MQRERGHRLDLNHADLSADLTYTEEEGRGIPLDTFLLSMCS